MRNRLKNKVTLCTQGERIIVSINNVQLMFKDMEKALSIIDAVS